MLKPQLRFSFLASKNILGNSKSFFCLKNKPLCNFTKLPLYSPSQSNSAGMQGPVSTYPPPLTRRVFTTTETPQFGSYHTQQDFRIFVPCIQTCTQGAKDHIPPAHNNQPSKSLLPMPSKWRHLHSADVEVKLRTQCRAVLLIHLRYRKYPTPFAQWI